MLTQYRLTLVPEVPCQPRAEWAYPLYAALLETAPDWYGRHTHQDGVTPISQFLRVSGDRLLWTVTLLGDLTQEALTPTLEDRNLYFLKKERCPLRVTERDTDRIETVEEMFARSAKGKRHTLTVQTPAAFKRQGKYLNLPNSRLILHSLMKKWNGSFLDCLIEDDDGQGLDAMAEGLSFRSFRLSSADYRLKGQVVTGFTGTLELENGLRGFHKDLTNALLYFSRYAGLGIKTTLGMGGILHRQT